MKSIFIFLSLLICTDALAKMPYPEIKTLHEQAMMVAPTKAQKLQYIRDTVLKGKNGGVRLVKVFENLEGRMEIDPDIPGLSKNILLTASDNPNVVTGAVRNHLYATRVFHDSRFKLLSMDEPQYGLDGKMITDKDIVFEHRLTGIRCRIESKNVKLSSQISNRQKYMNQIDKMADEFDKTGELQAWVNRGKVDPILKCYAESTGIPVFDQISTGEKALAQALVKGKPHFTYVLDHFDTQAKEACLLASDSATGLEWIGKVGKYGGTAVLIGSEGYMVWQYTHGGMTQRQFIKGQSGLAVGLVAAVPGAMGGTELGAFTGPAAPVCVPVFAFIGGVATGITGTMMSNAVVDNIYEKLDTAQQREVDQYVRGYYANTLVQKF